MESVVRKYVYYLTVKTSNHPDGNGKDEGIKHAVNRLEYGDMLDKRGVPYKTEDEGANEDRQYEDEELFYNIILIFRFNKVGEHLLHTDIFF